jgi:erythronate-4-phosphate dehydrogenase
MKTIGVVGVGHVGSRVAKTCEILGMSVLLNDPPRERMEGIDRTYHMVSVSFLQGLKKNALIINTSASYLSKCFGCSARGEILPV